MEKSQKCGSSEVAILGNTFQKWRKIVKLEKKKALVIAAGGNLTEIPPLQTEARKWQNLKKRGSSEVMILENTFQK